MPRIRCHYIDCVFLEEGYCGAAAVELDPVDGCLTYTRSDEEPATEEWVAGELEELWEDEDEEIALYEEDELEDDWEDDDENY